jgi:hypothetical protein
MAAIPGLGEKAKDSATGIEGIVTGRAEELNGSTRLALEYLDADRILRREWIEAGRLSLVTQIPSDGD